MTSLLLFLVGMAHAQSTEAIGVDDGFDAHGLHFAPRTGNPLDLATLTRPGAFLAGDAYASLTGEFADASLDRVIDSDGDGDIDARDAVVDDTVAVHMNAGLAFHERVRLDVAAPFFATSTDATGTAAPAAGDLRLSTTVAAVRPGLEGGPALALIPWMTAPTGNSERFLGSEAVTGGADASLGWSTRQVALTAQAGLAFRPDIDAINVEGTDAVRAGLGASTRLGEAWGLGAELRTTAPLDRVETAARVPLESIASVRWASPAGVTAMAGGSTGLTPGVGAPAWRAFAGVGFSRAQNRDPDLDALAWVDDDCPYVPELVNGYEDDDGCPETLGSMHVTAEHEGIPVDDAWIAVRHGEVPVETGRGAVTVGQLVPETTWTARAEHACLTGVLAAVADGTHQRHAVPMEASLDATLRVEVADPDGNPITEALLAWDDSPVGCGPATSTLDDGSLETAIGAGTHRFSARAPGYVPARASVFLGRGDDRVVRFTLRPTRVELTADRIRLRERIHFAFDEAEIRDESEPILTDLAQTLQRHPELTLIEIEGHADERGSDAYNRRLSARRAKAVRRWLVDWGIAPQRLKLRARGEHEPLVEDDSSAAYALNRRVQFHILQTEDS